MPRAMLAPPLELTMFLANDRERRMKSTALLAQIGKRTRKRAALVPSGYYTTTMKRVAYFPYLHDGVIKTKITLIVSLATYIFLILECQTK